MAVYGCNGCKRMISVSLIPGGNPAVKENPELWAQSYQRCGKCEVMYCERCAPLSEEACKQCNSALVAPDTDTTNAMYFGNGPGKFAGIEFKKKRKWWQLWK